MGSQDVDALDAAREEFALGLDAARELASMREWGAARAAVLGLVEEHAGAAYAIVHQHEIVELVRSCAFWMEHGEPDFGDAFSGELRSYDPKTGEVVVAYPFDARGLEDLERRPLGEGPGSAYLFEFPTSFTGPYSVRVEGMASRSGDPSLFVAMGPSGCYRVVVGTHGRWGTRNHKLIHVTEEGTEVVEERKPRAREQPVPFGVEVRRTQLLLKLDDRKVLSAGKPEGLYGTFAFVHSKGDLIGAGEELLVEGPVDRDWVNERLERSARRALRKFKRGWEAEGELPDWLLRKAEPEPDLVDALAERVFDHAQDAAHWDQIDELGSDGDHEGALVYACSRPEGQISERLREVARSFLLHELGLEKEALTALQGLGQLVPQVYELGLLEAQMLEALRRYDEAEAVYRGLIESSPARTTAREELANLLLGRRRSSAARAVVEEAILSCGTNLALLFLARLLEHAERGPRWRHPHVWETEHYRVVSNDNARVCRIAARELDHVFEQYSASLAPLPIDAREKLTVYIFATHADYVEYTEGLSGDGEQTAGMYYPVLQQLLLWIQPELEETRDVIRHEGLHQYLDYLVEDPPCWLNEGLAEYFEASYITKREFEPGAKEPLHLETLKRMRAEGTMHPLSVFVHQGRGTFYAHGPEGYAQAWALTHYLLHGGDEMRARFDALFELLCAGTPREEAIRTALGSDEELAKLDRPFRRYVRALLRK